MSTSFRKQAAHSIDGLYLVKRGPTYHIFGTRNGKRHRACTGLSDLDQATLALHHYNDELNRTWRIRDDGSRSDWKAVARWMWQRHKLAARSRSIPFTISESDIYLAMKTAGFKCSISGIPLSGTIRPNRSPDPWAPSIDRIDAGGGYSIDNVRITCLAANIAMNSWGYDVLLRLARGMSRNAASEKDEHLAHLRHHAPEVEHQVIDITSKVA